MTLRGAGVAGDGVYLHQKRGGDDPPRVRRGHAKLWSGNSVCVDSSLFFFVLLLLKFTESVDVFS